MNCCFVIIKITGISILKLSDSRKMKEYLMSANRGNGRDQKIRKSARQRQPGNRALDLLTNFHTLSA